ncbi:Outer membrane protein (porin) [Tistlia consotensis]|uniref:Outer membrane protein (Porin) n=1 Tax=Tistlia consotensis USBA 355 TaxID=560819 RepID=A0A1Y6BMW1_9PROT|nr:porin [Tistlia consotensis]SMF18990.1 Outer membrane protein (porin) [Tistlia consotensis USBA 355]SNR39272.1 Outer membrane protein (porin) [Tistlia consotensis]
MRKHIWAAGSGLAAGVLSAVSPAEAQVEIGLAGYMEQWLGYGHSDQHHYSGADVKSDLRLELEGETTLDNGLQFGVSVRVDWGSDPDFEQFIEAFLHTEGAFGRVEIGDRDSAAALMHYAAPDVGIGLNDGDVSDWVHNPTASDADSAFESTYLYLGEDKATKVTYFTPRIAGFQFGASYIPEFEQMNNEQPGDGRYHDGVALGGNFVDRLDLGGDRGPVAVAASATFLRATAPDSVAGVDDALGYAFGLNLGYAGFTLGGSYAHTAGSAAGGTDPAISLDGHGYDVGLAYQTGPWAFSLSHYHGQAKGDVALSGNDLSDVFMLSTAYALGPGVSLKSSAYRVDYDGGASDNSGYALVGGIVVDF